MRKNKKVGDLVRHTYDNSIGLIIEHRQDGDLTYPWRVQFFDSNANDWFMDQVLIKINKS